MFEHRRHSPRRRLVARNDRNEAGDPIGGEVRCGYIIDELSTNQRESHLRCPIELAVRHAQGERWSDEAYGKIVLRDALRQCSMHCCNLLLDSYVALAVTEIPQHAPDRIVDLGDVFAEEHGGADSLHVAPRIV